MKLSGSPDNVNVLFELARRIYHLPDRALHPFRRLRLERRLLARRPPGKILFVCLGNICRSPYAEKALVRATSKGPWSPAVFSAGFIGPGRPSPDTARMVARERGLDLSAHRSRQLTDEMLVGSDLVFVMDVAQRRVITRRTGRTNVFLLGDLDPSWSGRRAIRDPIEQPREVFERVYARIDRITRRLATLAGSQGARREPTGGPS